ncbi:MAG: hypothetical protein H3C35_10305 [Bacteroidetes bacterium]|nr:hypothetical protein [Bacteroidota bacterium]
MKYKNYIFTAIVLSAIVFSQAFSQAFLINDFSPKVTALGRTGIGMKGDVSLLFYNPASIEFGKPVQVFAGYTELYPLVKDNNLNVLNAGGAYTFGSLGTVGIGLSQFSPKFWTERTIVLSYATRMLLENLSLGFSAKLLSWSAEAPQGEYAVPEPALSKTNISFDAGLLYLIPEILEQNDLQIGIAVHDITQPSVAHNGSSGAKIPLSASAGFAFISHLYNYSLFGGASIKETDVRLSAGYEITALKAVAFGIENEFLVRLGAGRIINNDTQGDYNGGFGFRVENLRIDYSYTYQTAVRNIGGISSISIGYDF